jgi:histidinol-phosphate aminotransferase
MNRYWSKQIEDLDPYVPGEQPRDQQYIKLNTNENPYPPSPSVADLLRNFEVARLRKYPDPESTDLVHAMAAYQGLNASQVFVGNGSDEVLAHAFQAFFRQDYPILFPDISYSFYPFCINIRDYASTNGGIIIPNPNAPTGIALESGALRELLADNPESVVIIDEAYVDFGAESACPLIAEFPNLLVVQTFSKSRSMAGLRLGAAFGQENLIAALQRVKNSFNSYPVNILTSACALASLADEDYFQQCREQVIASRERLSIELQQLGFEVFPSSSNFVLVRHHRAAAAKLYDDLRSAGILVRHFKKARINNCLRISIGSDRECDALISALHKILA